MAANPILMLFVGCFYYLSAQQENVSVSGERCRTKSIMFAPVRIKLIDFMGPEGASRANV